MSKYNHLDAAAQLVNAVVFLAEIARMWLEKHEEMSGMLDLIVKARRKF